VEGGAMTIGLVGVGNILKATIVFTLFAVPPGYVAGWLCDLFAFRRGTLLRQAAIAIPLSVATLPIVIYLPWRFLSIRAVWVVMFGVWAAFLWMARRQRPAAWRPVYTVGLSAAAVWIAIALTILPDMSVGERWYYPAPAFDYMSRIPIVNGIAHQAKLPPQSPFLNPGRFVALRYHYFWPMVCGLVDAAGRGQYSARDAAIAGTIWAGIALLGVIALFLRFFLDIDSTRWRVYAIAMALLGVTGLDIIPVLIWDYEFRDRPNFWLGSVEWWNEQVTGWVDAMIWVPHHMAALVATLLAFLILQRGVRARHIILAGICLASAAGMSVYVTFTMAVILVVWALVMAAQRHFRPLLAVAAAGTLSLVLAAPFLMELQSGPSGSQGDVIGWNVRGFWFLRSELSGFELAGPVTSLAAVFWRLLFLPMNYFMELGAYLVVGFICCKRIWKARPISNRDLAALVMLITSVLIATFLKSKVGGNDLGWRSFMPAQFILLLWAAELFANWKASFRPAQSWLMILLLFVGVSSTVFDMALLRFFPVFMDGYTFDPQAGRRNRALADAYAWIRDNTPYTAVVQPNPEIPAFHYGLYADRPALAIGYACVGYSGEIAACRSINADLDPLFTGLGTPETFSRVCHSYPVDLIVVDAFDPSWNVAGGWVWSEKPVFSNRSSRVFACHPLLR